MSSSSRRLNVALLADDFNPEWPSLPIVAFKYARALAKFADVTVFTHVRNRENLEKAGPQGFRIVYLDNEYIAVPFHKAANWLRRGAELGWTIAIASRYLPYLEFERLALKAIAKQPRAFDLVHRITPMTPTLPSYAAGRSKAPFVIGPLNGNLPWPPQFAAEQKRENEMLARVKNIYKILPFHGSTYRKAAAILASFPHTIKQLNPKYADRIIDVPEIGYDEAIFHPPATPRVRGERLSFLYAGRLVPYKLPEFAVLAFAARPELRKHRLLIAGDGPELERLQGIVAEHSLEDCVTFLGRLSQAAIADKMRESDVFFFPSIRELGAGVVIEALACGLPCLVADYGAPGALIDDSRGRKVAIADRAKMIEDFADKALDLVRDRAALDRMTQAAGDYASTYFTWDNKAKKTIDIYNWVLDGGERPDFPY